MALVSYPIMLTGDKDTIREANPHWEPGVESWAWPLTVRLATDTSTSLQKRK